MTRKKKITPLVDEAGDSMGRWIGSGYEDPKEFWEDVEREWEISIYDPDLTPDKVERRWRRWVPIPPALQDEYAYTIQIWDAKPNARGAFLSMEIGGYD